MRARLLITASVLAVASAAASSSAAAETNEDQFTDRLATGHCLVADRHNLGTELTSRSGRFSLQVGPTSLGLQEYVNPRGPGGFGKDVWSRLFARARSTYGRLCMQADGNLVYRYGGHRRYGWSTHTNGSGTHNYARLLDTGRLVVRTTAGRTVWSSRTTPVLMIWKDRLGSGAELHNTIDARRRTHLTMRRSGELVLSQNKHVQWRSRTHVRGSYLVITSAGRAQIRTPSGRAVWSTPPVGRAAVLWVGSRGRLVLTVPEANRGRQCWVRPRNEGDCLG